MRVYVCIYIIVSRCSNVFGHNHNAQSDGNRAQPLNSFWRLCFSPEECAVASPQMLYG